MGSKHDLDSSHADQTATQDFEESTDSGQIATRLWQQRPRTTTLKSTELSSPGLDRAERATAPPARRIKTLRSMDHSTPPPPRTRWVFFAAGLVLAGAAVGLLWLKLRKDPVSTDAAPSGEDEPASATEDRAPTEVSAAVPPPPMLRLRIRVEPEHATARLDGKPLDTTGDIERELVLACPQGDHELRLEADGHEPLVKRLPCEGLVVMDLLLDER